MLFMPFKAQRVSQHLFHYEAQFYTPRRSKIVLFCMFLAVAGWTKNWSYRCDVGKEEILNLLHIDYLLFLHPPTKVGISAPTNDYVFCWYMGETPKKSLLRGWIEKKRSFCYVLMWIFRIHDNSWYYLSMPITLLIVRTN